MGLNDKSKDYQEGFAEYHNSLLKTIDESIEYKLNYEQFYRKIMNTLLINKERLLQIGNFNPIKEEEK